jgi:hypothetical protein
MAVNHLKGSNLLPAPVLMEDIPDGFKSWLNLRSPTPPPMLDGGQMTTADYIAMWTAWVAAFTAPKLGLYTAPQTVLPPGADVTALTEPVGSWYTAGGVVAVLSGPFQNPDGSIEVATNSHTWVYSGVSPGETIYGTWLNDVF